MIDYYDLAESGVKAKLRTLPIFPHAWQVSDNLGDLQKGLKQSAPYFAYVLPSTFRTTPADGREKFVVWSILFDFYTRYTTQKEALPLFKAGRKELFALNNDPMLNRTLGVYDVNLSATSELTQDLPGENPNWIIQTFNAAVSQRVRF